MKSFKERQSQAPSASRSSANTATRGAPLSEDVNQRPKPAPLSSDETVANPGVVGTTIPSPLQATPSKSTRSNTDVSALTSSGPSTPKVSNALLRATLQQRTIVEQSTLPPTARLDRFWGAQDESGTASPLGSNAAGGGGGTAEGTTPRGLDRHTSSLSSLMYSPTGRQALREGGVSPRKTFGREGSGSTLAHADSLLLRTEPGHPVHGSGHHLALQSCGSVTSSSEGNSTPLSASKPASRASLRRMELRTAQASADDEHVRRMLDQCLGTSLDAIMGDAATRHATEFVDQSAATLTETREEVLLYLGPTSSPAHPDGQPLPATAVSASPQLSSYSFRHLQSITFENEVERFLDSPSIGSDDAVNVGNCACSDADIGQFFPGFDLRRYHAHELFHHCDICRRRPATFLCLNCFKAVCPSHVEAHFLHAGKTDVSTSKCFLFLNLLELDRSFDKQLWCERCLRFTWKCIEVYEPLIEQILYTKGTYLTEPIRDLHVMASHVRMPLFCLPPDSPNAAGNRKALRRFAGAVASPSDDEMSTNPTVAIKGEHEPEDRDVAAASPTSWIGTQWRAAACSAQGWRTTQEDAETVFLLRIPRDCVRAPESLTDPVTTPNRQNSGSRNDSGTACNTESSIQEVSSALTCCEVPDYYYVLCACVLDGHGGDAVSKLCASALERDLQDFINSRLKKPASTSKRKRSASHLRADQLQAMARKLDLPSFAASSEPVASGLADDLIDPLARSSTTAAESDPGEAEDADEMEDRPALTEVVHTAFREAISAFDEAIRMSREGRQGDFNCVGSTLCVVAAIPAAQTLITVNLGDSQAAAIVRCTTTVSNSSSLPHRNSSGDTTSTTSLRLVQLTTPHCIEDPEEEHRIKSAGYSISDGRIEGLLAVPRALGDFDFKQCGGKSASEQAVSIEPVIRSWSYRDILSSLQPSAPTAGFEGGSSSTGGGGGSNGDSVSSPPPVRFSISEDENVPQCRDAVVHHSITPIGFLVACDGLWDSHPSLAAIERLLPSTMCTRGDARSDTLIEFPTDPSSLLPTDATSPGAQQEPARGPSGSVKQVVQSSEVAKSAVAIAAALIAGSIRPSLPPPPNEDESSSSASLPSAAAVVGGECGAAEQDPYCGGGTDNCSVIVCLVEE